MLPAHICNDRYNHPRQLRCSLAIGLAAAMLAACGGAKQTLPPPEPVARQATPIIGAEQAAAESGDFAALAALYSQAARTLSGDLRTAALLRAGEMQLATGDESAARYTLSELRGNRFAAVLQAQLLTNENLLDAAESELATLPSPVPGTLQPVTASARAMLLAKLGKLPEASTIMSAASYTDGPLGNEVERIVSEFQHWNLLNSQRIKPQWLSAVNAGGEQQRGWLALADIAQRGWQSAGDYPRQIQLWQQRYYDHSANDRIAPALLDNASVQPAAGKVALLLSATPSAEHSAIENGLLAANFANGSNELRVFRATPKTLDTQLRLITQWGAAAVIGPTDANLASSVQRFSRQRNAPVVITLDGQSAISGFATQKRSRTWLAFGLDPASEARSMASYAATQDRNRAVLLEPAGARGTSLHSALEIRLAELGGDLLSSERYAPDERDFRPLLKRLLEIDSSTAREEELSRLLGAPLASTNRGRTDVDFIAIDASPLQAKLIQQQLNELGVNSLPVLATNRLATGAAFNLNNLRFAAVPWQISGPQPSIAAELATQWKTQFRQHAAYYALGHDAYQLLPLAIARRKAQFNDKGTTSNRTGADIFWKTGLSQAWLNGGTGVLSIKDHAVQREMPIAEFNGGQIRAVR